MKDYYFYAEGLVVGYQGKPIVRDIHIRLRQGEILTLIGPNGAGKSTVLKSIAKQLSPLEGTIRIGGESLDEIHGDALARKMAVVFTERIHSELMTSEDVVATGRYPYTGKFGILSKADYRVVDEAMRLVHVEELKGQNFAKISDGQRQRVMLARALAQEPEILLLDEPTSYLDVKYKLEFLTVLQEMTRKKKLTVIMSLHELDMAQRISDRILCIGRSHCVEKFGRPEKIFTSGYIRRLFGMTAGNFDEGSGMMELEGPKGRPEVFVIAGNGTGRHVFRKLQRSGIPFVTGILYRNDIDYPTAEALAVQVIASEAFEEVPEEQIREARQWMDRCDRVICCRENFGTWDRANAALRTYAKESGKL